MRVAFDIGGVISKYPLEFREIIYSFLVRKSEVYIITDMHKREEVLEMLQKNGFGDIPKDNVRCADYQTHGEFCKAVLLKELGIDLFFDDFVGYINWDSHFGPAPIRCLVAPDGFRPYWHDSWQVSDNLDFGRRVYKQKRKEGIVLGVSPKAVEDSSDSPYVMRGCNQIPKHAIEGDELVVPIHGKPYFTKDKEKFDRLRDTWLSLNEYRSDINTICMDRSYQQIIGMGQTAIPFILDELRKKPNHWFWALKSITGEDPVPRCDRGIISKMTHAWLLWGLRNGYDIDDITEKERILNE